LVRLLIVGNAKLAVGGGVGRGEVEERRSRFLGSLGKEAGNVGKGEEEEKEEEKKEKNTQVERK
jgi:hypothetical protein